MRGTRTTDTVGGVLTGAVAVWGYSPRMADRNPDSSESASRMWRQTEAAMRVFGEVVLGEAVRNAPVEEGTLRGSATLDVDNSAPLHPRDGSTISVLVAFPVPYAAYQHEHTELSHPKGGSAKFLESAIQAHTPALERALAAGVNIESAFGGIGLASDGGAQIQEREL